MNKNRTDKINEIIKNAPQDPGVYLMKGTPGEVLYVGKAKNLQARIKGYFNGRDKRHMIPFLISKIKAAEFIITKTEKEALILENNLIKEHRPRYNIIFRDDKTYFSVRLDISHPFPSFQLVRRIKSDGARYFGPYPSSSAAKETLHFLQAIFPLRSCSNRELRQRRRPCLEYQIKRCLAPCVEFVDPEMYKSMVKDSIIFLDGREKGLLTDLGKRMEKAAQKMNFEEAALLRDRIRAIETTLEKQRIVSTNITNRDVFGLYHARNLTQALVLKIRGGRLLGKQAFSPIGLNLLPDEILASLVKQFYDHNNDIPPKIIVPIHFEDKSVIAEWLTEKSTKKVNLIVPKRGVSLDLLSLANHNAESILKTVQQDRENN